MKMRYDLNKSKDYWAFQVDQLENPHTHLSVRKINKNTSVIQFDLDKGVVSLDDIFSNFTKNNIRTIESNRINLLGLDGNKVVKIGRIQKADIKNKQVVMTLKWSDHEVPSTMANSGYDSNYARGGYILNKVGLNDAKFAIKMIAENNEKGSYPSFINKYIPKNISIIDGKGNFLVNKDEPTINYSKLRLGKKIVNIPVDGNLNEDPGGIIRVFYGTNRRLTGNKDKNDYYGNVEKDKESDILYGTCEVSVPRGHIKGNLERPKDYGIFKIFEREENEDKDIILKGIDELSKEGFIEIISGNFPDGSKKAALVFVHGYKVTFADAARQTGQIAWDLKFNGLTGFFSWPSTGIYKSYPADEEKAHVSWNALADYIETLCIDAGIEEIHFIAHSMGSVVLTGALAVLSTRPRFKDKLGIIKQVILGAPDIDKHVFEENILPAFENIGLKRTIYTSDKDLAMNVSKKFRGGRPRLGDAGKNIFVAKKIDTVDASNVHTHDVVRHSYIFECEQLLMDLLLLLNNGSQPVARGLEEIPRLPAPYWLFPKIR